jgi:hypothetical protein
MSFDDLESPRILIPQLAQLTGSISEVHSGQHSGPHYQKPVIATVTSGLVPAHTLAAHRAESGLGRGPQWPPEAPS